MSNDDLLLQVLLKLPAKSLIRFKSVSRRHTRLNPTSSTLGIYFHYRHKYSYKLKSISVHRANQEDLPMLTFIKTAFLMPHSDPPAIMHAFNGLLLCHYKNRPYFVCNIATQTFTILPQHLRPSSDWCCADHSAYLIFDPLKSPHFKVVLLGLSLRTANTILDDGDDYKETTTAYYTGFCYEIDVYSSEAGVWERKYFRASHGPHISYKAVCNGSLHWITKRNYYFQFEVDSWKLKFNPLPTKLEYSEVEKICYFGECCGRLFLTQICFQPANSFNVLGLDKNENNWTVKYRCDLCPFIAAFRDSVRFSDPCGVVVMNWNFSVLCVVKENETSDFALLLTIPGKVISYNLIRNTFKVLHEFPMQEFPLVNGYNFAHTFSLMATLSPV